MTGLLIKRDIQKLDGHAQMEEHLQTQGECHSYGKEWLRLPEGRREAQVRFSSQISEEINLVDTLILDF